MAEGDAGAEDVDAGGDGVFGGETGGVGGGDGGVEAGVEGVVDGQELWWVLVGVSGLGGGGELGVRTSF